MQVCNSHHPCSVSTGEYLPVRLAGGENSQEGRVELNINGTWGTICNLDWDSRDARVVCRQLGYTTVGAIYNVSFDEGIGELRQGYHCICQQKSMQGDTSDRPLLCSNSSSTPNLPRKKITADSQLPKFNWCSVTKHFSSTCKITILWGHTP